MVLTRGIETNPEKIQAIQELVPPRTIEDIQKLNERVTALSRFISKSGERCLPFFKILRGEHQTWNEDCGKAFQSLKEYLLSPPLLSAPPQRYRQFSVSSTCSRGGWPTAPDPLYQPRPSRRQSEVPFPRKTLFCADLCRMQFTSLLPSLPC
ncbi:hypothetical protein AXF42_Ash008836 [Apostasia shenzhenica]|uniref:Reverse transcriptase/retrotransposon-derived protein RNase H-like domain-containing protein n=1 Tax=Apostasia shenzhenica TaxID=1088818 RepID=A0A2I0ASL7_9ASPA|nr:hypothetical protein AXF42_Ash008836 [Apostasia shenzhenica]